MHLAQYDDMSAFFRPIFGKYKSVGSFWHKVSVLAPNPVLLIEPESRAEHVEVVKAINQAMTPTYHRYNCIKEFFECVSFLCFSIDPSGFQSGSWISVISSDDLRGCFRKNPYLPFGLGRLLHGQRNTTGTSSNSSSVTEPSVQLQVKFSRTHPIDGLYE